MELLRPAHQPRDEERCQNGTPYYDRDELKPELAEDMNVGDVRTFRLKKRDLPRRHPVTAKDVKWSLDRAVTVGGFPTFQMGAGSLESRSSSSWSTITRCGSISCARTV